MTRLVFQLEAELVQERISEYNGTILYQKTKRLNHLNANYIPYKKQYGSVSEKSKYMYTEL